MKKFSITHKTTRAHPSVLTIMLPLQFLRAMAGSRKLMNQESIFDLKLIHTNIVCRCCHVYSQSINASQCVMAWCYQCPNLLQSIDGHMAKKWAWVLSHVGINPAAGDFQYSSQSFSSVFSQWTVLQFLYTDWFGCFRVPQEDQVATTARKRRKRSRTQMQNPESRLEERSRWEALVDVSARQEIQQATPVILVWETDKLDSGGPNTLSSCTKL